MAEMAGVDFNKWKLLEEYLKRYISLQNYDSDFVKQISDYIILFIYGYATCAKSGITIHKTHTDSTNYA